MLQSKSTIPNIEKLDSPDQLKPQDLVQIFYAGRLDEFLEKKPFMNNYIKDLFKFEEEGNIEQDLNSQILAQFDSFSNFLQIYWIILTDKKTEKLIKNDNQKVEPILSYMITQISKNVKKIDDTQINKIILVSDILNYYVETQEKFIVQKLVESFENDTENNNQSENRVPIKVLTSMYIYDALYSKLSQNNEKMFKQFAKYLSQIKDRQSQEYKLCYKFMRKFIQRGQNKDWLQQYNIQEQDFSQNLGKNKLQDQETSAKEDLKKLFLEYKTKKYQNNTLIQKVVNKLNDLDERQECFFIVFQEMDKDLACQEKPLVLLQFFYQFLQKYDFQALYDKEHNYQVKLVKYAHKQESVYTQYFDEQNQLSYTKEQPQIQKKQTVNKAVELKELNLKVISKIYEYNGEITLNFFDELYENEIEKIKSENFNKTKQIFPFNTQKEEEIQKQYFKKDNQLKGENDIRRSNIQSVLIQFLVKNEFSPFENLIICIKKQNQPKNDQDYFLEQVGEILYELFIIPNQLIQYRIKKLLDNIQQCNDYLQIDLNNFNKVYDALQAKGVETEVTKYNVKEFEPVNAEAYCKVTIYNILNFKESIDTIVDDIYNNYQQKDIQHKIWNALFRAQNLEKMNVTFLDKIILKLVLKVLQNYGIYSFSQNQIKILDFICNQTHHQEQKYRDMALDALFEFYKQTGEIIFHFLGKTKPHIKKRFYELVQGYQLKEIELKNNPNVIIPHIEEKNHKRYFENENKNFFDFSENDKKSEEVAKYLIRDALLLFVVKGNTELLQFIKKQLLQLEDKQRIQRGKDLLFNETMSYFIEENQLIKKRTVHIFHYFLTEFSYEKTQIFTEKNLETLIHQFFSIMKVSSHSEIFAEDLFKIQKELIEKDIINLSHFKMYLNQINHNSQQEFSNLDLLINQIILVNVKKNKNFQKDESFQKDLKDAIKYIKSEIHKINELKKSQDKEDMKAFKKYKNGYIKTQFINVLAFILVILKENDEMKVFIEHDLNQSDKNNLGNKVYLYKFKYRNLLEEEIEKKKIEQ